MNKGIRKSGKREHRCPNNYLEYMVNPVFVVKLIKWTLDFLDQYDDDTLFCQADGPDRV